MSNRNPAQAIAKPMPAWLKLTLLIVLVLYIGVFVSRQLNFLGADLGRHITNGLHLVETGQILHTNFYSYTEPDYPVVNHHWGAGLLFYGLYKIGGFKLLGLFYTLCVLGGALLFIASALKIANSKIVFAVAVFLTPLITCRTEIRPEGISLLFLGAQYYLLTCYNSGKLKPILLWVLVAAIQLLWVNTHIFFFMGFVFTGIFLLHEIVNNRQITHLRTYGILLFLQIVVSLCNPFFIDGVLAPFTIFKEYGYAISENQSIPFLEAKAADTLYTHYRFILILLTALLLPMLPGKKIAGHINLLLPAILFGVLGYLMVRTIPLFGLTAIPALAVTIAYFIETVLPRSTKTLSNTLMGIAITMVSIGFINGTIVYAANKEPGATYKEPLYISPVKYYTGLGIIPGFNGSADFFIANKLKGPVFNDYDLGGYLIYNLYGSEKVFVDNRPEAYSVSFFRDTYIPMQQQPEKFRQVEKQYNFNCIWFYMREDSPWSRRFLWWAMSQPDYIPVFSDGVTLIFLKNNAANQQLIKQFGIDKSLFGRAG